MHRTARGNSGRSFLLVPEFRLPPIRLPVAPRIDSDDGTRGNHGDEAAYDAAQ